MWIRPGNKDEAEEADKRKRKRLFDLLAFERRLSAELFSSKFGDHVTMLFVRQDESTRCVLTLLFESGL